MSKTTFSLITTVFLALSASVAWASPDEGADASQQAADAPGQAVESVVADKTADESSSLMNQPVDFSSPEKVEKTLQNIRKQEGESTYKAVKGAMAYVLYYDLSLKNDKALLHAKLNGKTPDEIIQMMQR